MFALARLDLPQPVTLTIPGRRVVTRTFSGFDLCFDFVPSFRVIHARLAGIPRRLPIYGPEDWPHVLGDSPGDHAARVAEILGENPAEILQALLDCRDLPAPPQRSPRELPNWRVKAVLSQRGLLSAVNAAFASLPDAQRDLALLAWHGDAKCSRSSQAVLFIAAALGMTAAEIDELFREAERLEI